MTEAYPAYPKIPRLTGGPHMLITEKVDGTNGLIRVYEENGERKCRAGSRNRWLTPGSNESDNQGFAAWVAANEKDLVRLGIGDHYGEWWGRKIGRTYGQEGRFFSLFDADRWSSTTYPEGVVNGNPVPLLASLFPEDFGLRVVPTLYRGAYAAEAIENARRCLELTGSHAAPGWMRPEGVVIAVSLHRYSQLYKITDAMRGSKVRTPDDMQPLSAPAADGFPIPGDPWSN